ncbi:MAG: hypothetical protein V7723_07090 [Sneathiella sp.]|uniref:hypothetical protein n=1 Tax=Sneathiella sp. TaxID=1964365 RepID=UPI00300352F0
MPGKLWDADGAYAVSPNPTVHRLKLLFGLLYAGNRRNIAISLYDFSTAAEGVDKRHLMFENSAIHGSKPAHCFAKCRIIDPAFYHEGRVIQAHA